MTLNKEYKDFLIFVQYGWQKPSRQLYVLSFSLASVACEQQWDIIERTGMSPCSFYNDFLNVIQIAEVHPLTVAEL